MVGGFKRGRLKSELFELLFARPALLQLLCQCCGFARACRPRGGCFLPRRFELGEIGRSDASCLLGGFFFCLGEGGSLVLIGADAIGDFLAAFCCREVSCEHGTKRRFVRESRALQAVGQNRRTLSRFFLRERRYRLCRLGGCLGGCKLFPRAGESVLRRGQRLLPICDAASSRRKRRLDRLRLVVCFGQRRALFLQCTRRLCGLALGCFRALRRLLFCGFRLRESCGKRLALGGGLLLRRCRLPGRLDLSLQGGDGGGETSFVLRRLRQRLLRRRQLAAHGSEVGFCRRLRLFRLLARLLRLFRLASRTLHIRLFRHFVFAHCRMRMRSRATDGAGLAVFQTACEERRLAFHVDVFQGALIPALRLVLLSRRTRLFACALGGFLRLRCTLL